MAVPANYALRHLLNDEVHARPFEALKAPERLSYLVLLRSEADEAAETAAMAELCTRHNAPPPAPGANHYRADFGVFRVRWERHTEFTRYTFMVSGPFDDPFAKPALERIPTDWLASLPGEILVAAHAAIQTSATSGGERLAEERVAERYFAGNAVVGSTIAGGAARAFTDFRIHTDGFSRYFVLDDKLGTRQAGRMIQRLFEIDTYRMMASLALPAAREELPRLAVSERQLVEITEAMCAAGEPDEPLLLDRITRLAAEVERGISRTQSRFSASEAYFNLVRRRIEELREERIQGLQTFKEFTERRLAPAMNTCEAVAQQQTRLAERIGQTSQLLSTRVSITRERQNQALLASMNRRAQLQLRLQQTVEGLSVAAITYYTVGLVGYLAKAVKALGVDLNPDLAMGLSIPVVAIAVAYGTHHLKEKVLGGKAAPHAEF